MPEWDLNPFRLSLCKNLPHLPPDHFTPNIAILLIDDLCFSVISDYWHIQHSLPFQFDSYCSIYALYNHLVRHILLMFHIMPPAHHFTISESRNKTLLFTFYHVFSALAFYNQKNQVFSYTKSGIPKFVSFFLIW